MMTTKPKTHNAPQNRSGFALLTVALFLLSGLAAVSASPVQKEYGATIYDSVDESAMNLTTQYVSDGVGVNIDHPGYGAAGSQLSRFSERYPTTDGENLTFWDRSDVPNPREISNSLCQEDQSHPDSQGLSDYNWLWGQFITHEIDHTTTQDGRTPDQDQPDTAYITISEDDEWMGFPGGLQMRFFRSLVADGTGDGDPLNQREHPNTITTWIDGSVVYGSDEGRADWLREHRAGRMKVSDFEEGDLLPQANYAEDPTTPGMSFAGFNFSNSFVAGDGRANEHVALLSMHTLFVREHNRLAGEILDRNPDWSDEQIYQYARHINIGLIESITYNEFLPSLGIELDSYSGYDPTIDPSISNEFATVAFRMGHSQIGSTMFRLNETRMTSPQGHLTLREGFFDVTPITEGGGIGPILRGLAYNVQPENDLMFVDDLRNQMFGPPGAGGMDLCAIDIQRGRDHGVPDFNTVREAFGLAKYTDWSDFTSDNTTIEALNNTYPDVDSVDALIGMLAEDHIANSTLGETMHVIIKEQFGRLRDSDRLYYGSEFSELSGIQDQINSTTLADVILRNTEIERIQCNVFFSEQVLDEMDCNLQNKAVTSDGSNNNNDPSASTGGADIIKYSVPLLLIILVLILANAQSTASNEFEKKEKAEKPLLKDNKGHILSSPRTLKQGSETPDVSVIIPYHKDRGFLSDAIESYESQVFSGTSELILSYGPEKSLGGNFNEGIKKAKGKYVKILPDDDLLTPNCLQDLFDAAYETDADLIFAQAHNFAGQGVEKISQWPIPTDLTLQALIENNFIHAITTLYRTEMLVELGGFDVSMWTAEEYEFHLRCLASGYKPCFVESIVCEYREWAGSKSRIFRLQRRQERLDYIEKVREKYRLEADSNEEG